MIYSKNFEFWFMGLGYFSIKIGSLLTLYINVLWFLGKLHIRSVFWIISVNFYVFYYANLFYSSFNDFELHLWTAASYRFSGLVAYSSGDWGFRINWVICKEIPDLSRLQSIQVDRGQLNRGHSSNSLKQLAELVLWKRYFLVSNSCHYNLGIKQCYCVPAS